jgi:type VI secretion system protein ImpM
MSDSQSDFLDTVVPALAVPNDFALGSGPSPGWFGKLPSLGDFASRRASDKFVRVWDAWLQRALSDIRLVYGEAWQEVYLRSPAWQFIIFPGLLDSGTGYAGVMMSSADKVGRNFPLTVVCEVSSAQSLLGPVIGKSNWHRAVQGLMSAAIKTAMPLEQFEQQLAALPYPETEHAAIDPSAMALGAALSAAHRGEAQIARLASSLPQAFTGTAQWQLLHQLQGYALWWTVDTAGSTYLLPHRSQPDSSTYSAMLQVTG